MKITVGVRIIAIFISIILIVAALGKMTHPMQSLKVLQWCAAIFEICLAIILLCFQKYWQVWLTASFIFASWAGYSLYWVIKEIPCACFGALYSPPSGVAFGIAVIFFVLCLMAAYGLKATRRAIMSDFVISVAGVVFGFFFARSIYTYLAEVALK